MFTRQTATPIGYGGTTRKKQPAATSVEITRLKRSLAVEMAGNNKSAKEIVEKTGLSIKWVAPMMAELRKKKRALLRSRPLREVTGMSVTRLNALDTDTASFADGDDVEAAVTLHAAFLQWRRRYVVNAHLNQVSIDDIARSLQTERETVVAILKASL